MPLAPQSVLGGPNPNPNHHPHRRCLAGAAILLPKHEVEAMLDAASARDGEVYWRAITLRLGKIEFNANDGLDQVAPRLILILLLTLTLSPLLLLTLTLT